MKLLKIPHEWLYACARCSFLVRGELQKDGRARFDCQKCKETGYLTCEVVELAPPPVTLTFRAEE